MSDYVPEISEELMAGFLDEAPEYLEMLDAGLMAFEEKAAASSISMADRTDQGRMNEMFRAAHSLKGLAAAMGFDKIRELTHRMETLFDHIRMDKRTLEPYIMEALFGVFDTLKALVKELSSADAQPVSIDGSLAKLDEILNASPSTVPSAAPVVHAKPKAETPAAPIEAVSKGGMVLDNPELAQLFVETTLETLDELNQKLLTFESAQNSSAALNDVFRCAHNIKGATGAAGCTALYHLTHDLESALDLVRKGQLNLDDELMQTVFGVVDRVRADVLLIKDGKLDKLTSEGTTGLFEKWLGKSEVPPAPLKSEMAAQPCSFHEATGCETEPSEDSSELSVTVTFPPDFAESEIQAYLIHNKLRELGDVTESNPDVEKLDGSAALTKIVFKVNSGTEPAKIREILSFYQAESISVAGGTTSMNDERSAAESQAADETLAVSVSMSQAKAANKPLTSPQSSPTAEVDLARDESTASSADSGKSRTPAKVGETIRVDLERLDQLMNLGGELVINRARLSQIHGRLDPIFQGQNLNFLIDGIAERLSMVQNGLDELQSPAKDPRVMGELREGLLHLTHEFDVIRGAMRQVYEGRTAMNDFSEALHALTRVSDGMQKRIMETRMVTVGPLFQRFKRVVRDIAKATQKNVELVLHGEATELDKRMIDELGDPLTHMIRNSVDHGIESPADRLKTGKPEVATVTLDAYHRGRHICIEIKDDGRGINVERIRNKVIERGLATQADVDRMSEKELIQYIFKPGFSTAEKVTDLSGRGMGMDIVLSKLESINGTVEVESVEGEGTTFVIRLPLTLAIITALISRVGKFIYAIPLDCVAEIITVPQASLQSIQRKRVVRVRDRVIPVALFEEIFASLTEDSHTLTRDDTQLTLVIIKSQGELIGLVVDELIGQEDVVIKSIAENFRNVQGVTGASIMGDGTVSLILDAVSMMSMFAARAGQPLATQSVQRIAEPSERKELTLASA